MSKIHYQIVDTKLGEENIEKIDFNTLLFSYPCKNNFSQCTPYKVTLSTGLFRIECYGGGGTLSSSYAGGGYTSGIIKINKTMQLYLYIGYQDSYFQEMSEGEEIFNGGGGNIEYSYTGSGATDVRLHYGDWKDFSSLRSRIMVAGGSGGTECGLGGVGGGLIGGDGHWGVCNSENYTQIGYGASNTQGGDVLLKGKFGYAQSGTSLDQKNFNCGGGGYYGGGSNNDFGSGAGGGSSFISGHPGCDAISKDSTETHIIHTNQSIHYSNIFFISTTILSGNDEFITPNRTTKETGHPGSGNVVITYLSPLYCSVNTKEHFDSCYLFVIVYYASNYMK